MTKKIKVPKIFKSKQITGKKLDKQILGLKDLG